MVLITIFYFLVVRLGPIPGGVSLLDMAFRPNDDNADCLLNIKECAGYAFQTVLWREARFEHFKLSKVYRQKKQDFVRSLMDIRTGESDTGAVKNLVDRCSSDLESREELNIPEGIKPTILYCTNRNVDKENNDNLAKLKTIGKSFTATDSVKVLENQSAAGTETVKRHLEKNGFFNDCAASKVIHLKVGAQVMLLQNLDLKQGLVNGSRGVVESFKLCPIVKVRRRKMMRGVIA